MDGDNNNFNSNRTNAVYFNHVACERLRCSNMRVYNNFIYKNYRLMILWQALLLVFLPSTIMAFIWSVAESKVKNEGLSVRDIFRLTWYLGNEDNLGD